MSPRDLLADDGPRDLLSDDSGGEPTFTDYLKANPVGGIVQGLTEAGQELMRLPMHALSNVMLDDALSRRIRMGTVKLDDMIAQQRADYQNARSKFKNFVKDYNIPETLANTGAGLALGSVVKAPQMAGSVLSNIGRGTLQGAKGGAIASLTSPTSKDNFELERAGKAALGGVTGGLAGGIVGSSSPTIPASERGAEYVRRTLEKSGKTLDDLAEEADTKPITAAEAIGPQAETNLMALGRREGQTGNELQSFIRERSGERSERVLDDMAVSAGIHPDAAHGRISDYVKSGQAEVAPLYKKAFERPGYAVWSPRIQEFLDDPLLRTGLARGIRIQQLEALEKGVEFKPSDYGVTMDDTGVPIISWTSQGGTPVPNLRTLDAAKRGIDAILEDHRNPITKTLNLRDPMVKAINGVRMAYIKAVDQVAPEEYQAARALSGDYLSAESAFQMGQKSILNSRMTEKQFGDVVSKMTPTELEALKGGIANKVFELSQNNTLKPKQFLTNRVKTKLDIALGPNQAESFVKNLEQESAMKAFEQKAIPSAGSQTAPLRQAMSDQDAFDSYPNHTLDDVEHALVSGHSLRDTGFRLAKRTVGRMAKDALARLRTQGLSTEARNEAGRLLMMSPKEAAKAIPKKQEAPRAVPWWSGPFDH